jgi:hypothetical protein
MEKSPKNLSNPESVPSEHDDDITPRVEEGADFEIESFPIVGDDDDSSENEEETDSVDDPDPSEI